jgi:serine/threonine protein kinase
LVRETDFGDEHSLYWFGLHVSDTLQMLAEGSRAYLGPERLIYKNPFARDVYGLGVSMIELIAPGFYVSKVIEVWDEAIPDALSAKIPSTVTKEWWRCGGGGAG